MLESLITQNEGKTLEFKENTKSLQSIVKAVISFANTAGGVIIIGVSDKDKKIIGLEDPLLEEERLASVIADSIEPLVIPDIQIVSFRNRELLLVQVPHMVGPFYLKSAGLEKGTFVRLGSTNRVADHQTILSLQLLAKNTSFDELPVLSAKISDIDDELLKICLMPVYRELTQKNYESLGLLARQNNKSYPTNAGLLLCGRVSERLSYFPDSTIACVCFSDETHAEILDQQEIKAPLIKAHEEVLSFIGRNTRLGAKIQASVREDIPQYPPQAVREALINAIVHADYSMRGTRIQVSIFSNRIEITNPGSLAYGQTMALALSGVSRMRNRVIGRLFREIKLIEQLGTGLKRMLSVYEKVNAKPPIFQELNTHFRVTLFSVDMLKNKLNVWEKLLIEKLEKIQELGTTEIAKLWGVTTRTARTRLNKMLEAGLVNRIATSPQDPQAVFKLK